MLSWTSVTRFLRVPIRLPATVPHDNVECSKHLLFVMQLWSLIYLIEIPFCSRTRIKFCLWSYNHDSIRPESFLETVYLEKPRQFLLTSSVQPVLNAGNCCNMGRLLRVIRIKCILGGKRCLTPAWRGELVGWREGFVGD